jgi:hypothetical protein
MPSKTYDLIKTLRKEAGMQVGPQPTGGAGGGAGGKIPPGFLAGMNQRKEEEAAAAKEESETAQSQAMDDAAKQQDMQIKQVEMEQRLREQNSQKMQEMQAEQARLQTEAASLKEQMKQKDLMHKEQLKHNNELVKAQLQHQQTLDSQIEAHKARMQTGFSSTLVSRSKSLKATIEKLHKMASASSPFGKPKMSGAFISLHKCATMVPATTKQQPGAGPSTPKSMTSTKITGGGSTTVGKTPLDTAPRPNPNSLDGKMEAAGNQFDAKMQGSPPAQTAPQPSTQQTPTQQPVSNFGAYGPMGSVADRVVGRIDPAAKNLSMTHFMSAMPNAPGYGQAISKMHNATWDAAKNLRADLNAGYNDYYKANNLDKGTLGDGSFGGMLNKGTQKLTQGLANIPAYTISTAAQGFGHAGEHFKDVGRRWDNANTTFNKQKADQEAARQAGQQAIDNQWNKDMENGGVIDAAWNYATGKYNPNAETDSWHNQLGDWVDRSWNWGRDALGGGAAAAGKGLANTATAAVETGLNMTGVGAAIGAAASDPNEQSRGWDLFNTDAELAEQAKQEEAERKRILDETSPNTDPASYSTSSLIPNASTIGGGHGMNDAMRLQHTGYGNRDVIGSAMNAAVDPLTGMMMPFTQTDGYSLDGGYSPNDMMSAFQSSPFHSPGYKNNYNALDQAFFNGR